MINFSSVTNKLIATVFVLTIPCFTLETAVGREKDYSAYLFSYFTGNGPHQEQIRFAVSTDGFDYRALNNNEPVVLSKEISSTGGVRDPHILRAADGEAFYMVATDLYVPEMGWHNYAMIMMKSKDLVNWQSSVVNVPETYPDQFGKVHRVWAPQTFYDHKTDKYMVYFSMKEGNDPDKIYYAYANDDFTGFEAAPKQLYYPPASSNTRACIDGDIIYKDGKYYLFYKAEDGDPGIKLAISDELTEGYELVSSRRIDRSRHPVEGSGIFKLNGNDDYILMYDVYTRGQYQFTRSSDLMHFEIIDNEISMDFHPRHGTVMPITAEELLRLVDKWGSPAHLGVVPTSESVKSINVKFNPYSNSVHLPVSRGTDLSSFDPTFRAAEGIKVVPQGKQDFTNGPVDYCIGIKGQQPMHLRVSASLWNNPVLSGYYADPDIIYAEKTGKYYIYPTSDGYTGWSGTYFKTFSSENLVDWKDEGVILDLKTDVDWTSRNAWAPCIIEKKIDGEYKYFYYFTAAQRIGVAVADDPTGPFVDSGEPLIDWRPSGIRGGQEIDPDVFRDPLTGKYYLYWGNGYMAVVELNDNMVSIKKDTLEVMTPDRTFREGAHVFYRDGKYYFLWSENDTRSEDYRVRYAIADSPTGPLVIPEDNLVIAKDPELGIYGTGHNSTINVPGTDDWYIVYHRFTYPNGIKMGRSAGFHRETCIDKMTFDASGKIERVQPTHEGVTPVTKSANKSEKDYTYEPVAFTKVHFNDAFWAPRIETNRSVTIPYAFEKCEQSKRFYNFERAAKVLKGESVEDLSPPGFPFDDTDPYKVLEGASYGLAVKYDPEMDAYLDKIIALIASAQEPDGYLFTCRTFNPDNPHDWAGKQRWSKVKQLSHELYNMGHLYEAAVAHYQATGKRSLLNVAIKNADLLCEVFGPGKNEDAPGHQIIEMGLVKLYRATGNEKYLELAKFFLDARGPGDGEYSQAHEKVVDQSEAVGHAVRATYMYSGMADVAALTGDPAYKKAMDRIWQNMTAKKLYITGGIGATGSGEAFGPNYVLPNMSAYCETCAAIGNVYWNQRMFLLHGDSKYIDVLERTLYNALISGISLQGKDFFYPNPLESKGQHQRSPWFGCACCPGNIARFLASVPGYAYAKKDDNIFVNLFAAGTAEIQLPDNAIKMQVKTQYPWQGDVKMTVLPQEERPFTINLRIPGWAMNQPVPSNLYHYKDDISTKPMIKLNGKAISYRLTNGYARLTREWKQGDTIDLKLPMVPRKVFAHPNVKADRNRLAIERGPIVYCLEGVDHPDGQVRNLTLSPATELNSEYRPDMLGGIQVITGVASKVGIDDSIDARVKVNKVPFTAIPYYAWCNRGPNEMVVWLPTLMFRTQMPVE